jgi:putative oxidoreductase
MKNKITLVCRILLGLVFFVFGLNGFFHFIPVPPMEGIPATFFTGLAATGYFLPVLAATQAIGGALLLVGAFVPLALVVLAPVIFQIFLFHVFVDRSGLPMALVIGALEIYLAFFSEPYSPIVKQIFRCPMKEAMDAKKK